MIKHIFGQLELEGFLNANPGRYDVIHYTDSRWEPLPCVTVNAREWFHMPFDDVDRYFNSETRKITCVKYKDVKKLLEWAYGKQDLIVACRAGISRSSATAYICAAQELGAKAGLNVLNEDKHWPNRIIVYLGACVLNNVEIWDEFVNWQQSRRRLDPSEGGKWPSSSLKLEMVNY